MRGCQPKVCAADPVARAAVKADELQAPTALMSVRSVIGRAESAPRTSRAPRRRYAGQDLAIGPGDPVACRRLSLPDLALVRRGHGKGSASGPRVEGVGLIGAWMQLRAPTGSARETTPARGPHQTVNLDSEPAMVRPAKDLGAALCRGALDRVRSWVLPAIRSNCRGECCV